MTMRQFDLSAPRDAESYNGCSSNVESTTYGDKCNADSASNAPFTASGSRRRKLYSDAFAARFWSQVDKSGSCWLWTGATLKRPTQAYGYIWDADSKKTIQTHRVSWELAYGAIPRGMKVLHRCDNPRCVSPSCLWLGTQLENMRDMIAKGRRSPHAHALKGKTFSADHRAALSEAQRQRHTRRRKQVA